RPSPRPRAGASSGTDLREGGGVREILGSTRRGQPPALVGALHLVGVLGPPRTIDGDPARPQNSSRLGARRARSQTALPAAPPSGRQDGGLLGARRARSQTALSAARRR